MGKSTDTPLYQSPKLSYPRPPSPPVKFLPADSDIFKCVQPSSEWARDVVDHLKPLQT